MVALKKILLPTDFSERSAGAALHAKLLARQFGAELIVMHVIPPFPIPEVLDAREILEGCKARGWSRLNGMYSDNGFRPHRLLVEGDPAEAIVKYAREHQVDLIMMPTAGGASVRRYLLGSVTAKTLHDAGCPVWTTAHVADNNGHSPAIPKQIVCAVDLEPGSDRVIGWAVDLAEAFAARLTVVHALPNPHCEPAVYYLDADLRRYLTGRSREQISAMLRETARPATEIVVDAGPVSNVVRSVAEERKAQLVIIGRSQSGSGGIRTNSYTLIREAPCPVVSI
jgi:nucleotide-binding universal stress UspA family protein